MPGASIPDRHCASCGRAIAWRRKWADDWDNIRFCGEKCRRNKPRDVDRALEAAIVDLLERRTGTICPSEAARAVGGEDDWRGLMENARAAGRRLAVEERIVFSQKGRVVDPSTAKGAVRLGRGRRFGSS